MFGYDWKIKLTKNCESHYNWNLKEIIISTKNKEEGIVFFHEILECMMTVLHYRYYGQEDSMEFKFILDHSDLHKVAQQLWIIFSDNKLLR